MSKDKLVVYAEDTVGAAARDGRGGEVQRPFAPDAFHDRPGGEGAADIQCPGAVGQALLQYKICVAPRTASKN